MNSIRANKTWYLVELPKNRRVLPCKWVFRLKEMSVSPNPKYKAKLVAKGFQQEYGVNFDEIFSPVVKMTTLCFMLDVVATENLELIQLDVKTIFLHVYLKEGNIYGAVKRLCGIQPRTCSLPTRQETIWPQIGTAIVVQEV